MRTTIKGRKLWKTSYYRRNVDRSQAIPKPDCI